MRFHPMFSNALLRGCLLCFLAAPPSMPMHKNVLRIWAK